MTLYLDRLQGCLRRTRGSVRDAAPLGTEVS